MFYMTHSDVCVGNGGYEKGGRVAGGPSRHPGIEWDVVGTGSTGYEVGFHIWKERMKKS